MINKCSIPIIQKAFKSCASQPILQDYGEWKLNVKRPGYIQWVNIHSKEVITLVEQNRGWAFLSENSAEIGLLADEAMNKAAEFMNNNVYNLKTPRKYLEKVGW